LARKLQFVNNWGPAVNKSQSAWRKNIMTQFNVVFRMAPWSSGGGEDRQSVPTPKPARRRGSTALEFVIRWQPKPCPAHGL